MYTAGKSSLDGMLPRVEKKQNDSDTQGQKYGKDNSVTWE